MITAMFNAVLLPNVRYHAQLSPTAKLLFCEMTACVDDNQIMDDDPTYFERTFNLTPSETKRALDALREYGFIKNVQGGKIWVNL